MNAFAISAYITAITTFLIGLFAFIQNKRQLLNKVFFFYSSLIACWAALTATHSITNSHDLSLLCAKLMHVPVIFLSILFFYFILILLEIHHKKKFIFLLILGYLGAISFSIYSVNTDLIVSGVRNKLGYRYFMDAGVLYPFYISFWCIYVFTGLFLLFRAICSAQAMKKQQYKYLFAGSLIGYGIGAFNFLPVYDITIFPYPYASFGITFYVFVTAYAIAKYKFLDIDIIIRRTVVFAGLLGFVFAVFSAAAFLVREVLSVYLGVSNVWTYAISLFLIVLGYDPIRSFLINLTDKYFFQKKYDYQKILKDAARGMSRIESLQHMFSLVTHFITMRMRIKNAAVLTWQESKRDYKLNYQRGYERNFVDYHLSFSHPLIQFLRREKEAIDIERIKEYIDAGSKKRVKGEAPHEYDFQVIKDQMEEMGAACCVPSFLGTELQNILILGEKKSGDYYSNEDLNVLFTLAQESAIAIENARLYDEAVHKTEQLQKINEQLQFSKDLLTKSLAETEVANKQLQDTQAQLIHEQKMATLGRLAASVGHEVNNPLTILSMNVSRVLLKYRKNPDMKVADILELFDKMEQNINRIKAVVNTLTGLLKKSEKGKFEPLSLKLILEETLPLVQFQTYLDNLTGTEVEFDVPSSLPLVRGDLERLQEVFLNLFINAYHAMAGKRNRRIRVWAEIDTQDHRYVAIHFVDNGSGMPPETMAKIFNYGFTTKPPGRGSGLGLYMCKYIIELHGGTIIVASKIGEGTTFTLTLPVFEETGLAGFESRQATTG